LLSDAEVTTDLDSGDTLDASRGGVSDSAPMPVATPPDSGVVRVNDGLGAVREMDRALSGGHAVRFVWRGAFDPPFFVRIDWKPDGCWLTAKRVTFSSNDNFETITSLDVSKHRHLTAAECERAAGAEAALRSAPPDDGKPGLDGATWTVDGVQGTRRFRSARWSPEDGGFRKACMVLFDLAGPRLMDQAPY
jgi:hypothetical protein